MRGPSWGPRDKGLGLMTSFLPVLSLKCLQEIQMDISAKLRYTDLKAGERNDLRERFRVFL